MIGIDPRKYGFTEENYQEEGVTEVIEKGDLRQSTKEGRLEMKELSIIEKDGIQAVSARELYKGLEISKRFSEWFAINSKDFVENEDFTSVLTSTVVNNGATRALQDYAMSIDMAKAICLMSRTEIGKSYRNYLIKLEKAWNTPEAVMARALQVANRTLENATKQISLMQPKADYYDRFLDGKNLTEIGHLGKTTKIGELNIFKRLKVDGYIKERWSTDGIKYYDPCFGYDKYFKSISVPFIKDGKAVNRDKLMLTAEGVSYFMKKYNGDNDAN